MEIKKLACELESMGSGKGLEDGHAADNPASLW
jgi:hypothetical protein